MNIGRKIYYNQFGDIMCDAGEREGDVRPTTQEEDLQDITGVVGYIEFEYGQTPQELIENLYNYKVDILTKSLVSKG